MLVYRFDFVKKMNPFKGIKYTYPKRGGLIGKKNMLVLNNIYTTNITKTWRLCVKN